MHTQQRPSTDPIQDDSVDFSLVLGGFFYQVLRRAHLSGDALQLLSRRVIVLSAIAWVPLLILCVAAGSAWSDKVELPFLHDIEMHVRLLVALPILIGAELIVHQRVRPVVAAFVERKLIPQHARTQFDAAVTSAMRWRNSVVAELLMIVIVYLVGILFIWRTQMAMEVSSWYGTNVNDTLQLSWAGRWMEFISLPIFQIMLLRWYYRILIWTRFLWQVSRIKLNLLFANPDRCGGLGFLSQICYAFAPLLLAQGALLAGMLSDRVLFSHAKLTDFQLEIVGMVALVLLSVLGPLMVFSTQLLETKRIGMLEFGNLMHRAVGDFHARWLIQDKPPSQSLIDPPDIQSLANLGSSYECIKQMSWIPFTLQNVLQLAIMTLLPVAPLLLSMFSLEELLGKLFKILF